MASHQPGVVCESDQPGPGPWAQIKDSLPNAHRNKEKRKTKQQHQQNSIKKTWNWNNHISDSTEKGDVKKGSASKTNVLKNESRIEQMGLFLAQGGRRESLLCECSLHIPWAAIDGCTACCLSLLLGKLCGVENFGALLCQGANSTVSLSVLYLGNLSLGLGCKNNDLEEKSITPFFSTPEPPSPF